MGPKEPRLARSLGILATSSPAPQLELGLSEDRKEPEGAWPHGPGRPARARGSLKGPAFRGLRLRTALSEPPQSSKAAEEGTLRKGAFRSCICHRTNLAETGKTEGLWAVACGCLGEPNSDAMKVSKKLHERQVSRSAQTALDAFARSSRWRQALLVVCRHRLHTDVARQTTMESCQRAGHWSPLRRASSVSGGRAKEQALLQRFDAVVAAGRADTPFLAVAPNDEQQLSTLTRSALQSALALAKRLERLWVWPIVACSAAFKAKVLEFTCRISAKLVVADKDCESAARRQTNALEAAKASAAAAISRREKAAAKQAAAVKAAEAKRNAVKKAAERAAEAKRIAAQKAAEKAAEAKRNAAQKAPEKVNSQGALPSKTGKSPGKVRYIDSGPAAGWHVKGRAYPTAIAMWVLPPNGSVWLSRVQALKELEGSDPTVIEAIDRVRWQVQQELKGRGGPVAEPSAAEGGTRKKLRLSWSEESHRSSSSSSSSVRMLS
eukprot:s1098_g3.t2